MEKNEENKDQRDRKGETPVLTDLHERPLPKEDEKKVRGGASPIDSKTGPAALPVGPIDARK